MNKNNSIPKWMDRKVLKDSDSKALNQRAAELEFKNKMPRDQAEDAAYKEYVKDNHKTAAAHHLQGIKGASSAGDMEEGRRHGLLYSLHMKALGHDPNGPVPPDIKSVSDGGKFYKFKPHKADLFLLGDRLD